MLPRLRRNKTLLHEHSGDEIASFIENNQYPKPRWLLSESITDDEWIMAKVGSSKNINTNSKNSSRLSFKREVAPGEYLTDKNNSSLILDIRNSLLYLNTIDSLSRPQRASNILISAAALIRHTNELRLSRKEPLIRTLEMIKFADINSYLSCFSVTRDTFEYAISKLDGSDIFKASDSWWLSIKDNLKLTTREVLSLKRKLRNYLKSKGKVNSKATHYTLEYANANTLEFDIEVDLNPSQKTISNEVSKLEALYLSREAQRYKFQHSTNKLFSDGSFLFTEVVASQKTPLIPANIALFAFSKSLEFVKTYGSSIRQFSKLLSDSQKVSISELKISPSRIIRNTKRIREHAFKRTVIPDSLSDLNITSWETKGSFENTSHTEHRKSLSYGAVILLYVASMWIILATFTAGRKESLLLTKRNCFRQSPIDGLFDIVFKMPKLSERFELEEFYRPIPDIVFDYGIEFAEFVSGLEERQGYFFREDEVFLFGKILSLQSYDSFGYLGAGDNTDSPHKYALSNDTICKAMCFFQDWTESPLIEGKRWYPSNHQFRRLFAVLYFSFSDQAGLEELSWFMGHSTLDQTFHYAELNPSDTWIEEAELTIAKIGSSLRQKINADNTIYGIVKEARKASSVELVLEPLIRGMIDEHKKQTGEEVRFYRLNNKDVFFYFHKPEKS